MRHKEYIIERPDYSDTLKVRVYKTAKSMMQSAKLLDKTDKSPEKFTAMFHTTHGIDTDKDGMFMSSMYGIIILNEQNMDLANVSHECLHAAFAHDRRINRYIGKYEHEHEERFARYFEWLLTKVLETLKTAGYKVK